LKPIKSLYIEIFDRKQQISNRTYVYKFVSKLSGGGKIN